VPEGADRRKLQWHSVRWRAATVSGGKPYQFGAVTVHDHQAWIGATRGEIGFRQRLDPSEHVPDRGRVIGDRA